jgi:phage terminase large subunit
LTEYQFKARPAFLPFHNRTQRFSSIVAHRRAGKTVACVIDLIRDSCSITKSEPRLAYIAPTYQQAKDIAWSYLKRFTAPMGVIPSESELSVVFPNKARIRLYGAESYDRIRGLYLDGCIIDEPADIDPRAWPEVIRPALADREGRATFIGTPKGRNWFHAIHKAAQDDPAWFSSTLKASETGLLPQSELDDLRKMLTEEQYAQELECSFDAAIRGAYYGKQMQQAESEGRVCSVAREETARVWTAWDLGVSDHTSIWFCQMVGREIRIIDYYEASGEALSHYVGVLDKKGYVYGGHLLPHDVEARELGTGKSRREVLEGLGIKVLTVPNHNVEDGISGVRAILSRCWFDKVKTARGVECLTMYRADYDDKLQTLRSRPVHDWASHGADAFRYLAMGLDYYAGIDLPKPKDRYRDRRDSDTSGSWMSV